MKSLFLLLCLCATMALQAQTKVVYDMETAKTVALAENKLIIADFWATWCKPCRNMDAQLWNSAEFDNLSDKFVLAKIDVDRNKQVAAQFGVQGIPRVIVMTANEEPVYDNTGFTTARPYLDVFETIPGDVAVLNTALAKVMAADKPDAADLLAVGQAYQTLGYQSENVSVKRSFFGLSNNYLKDTQKSSESDELNTEAELNMVLNDAFVGKHKKVLKKLKDIEVGEDMALKDLKLLVMSYCYKCDGEMKKAEEMQSEIQNKSLIARIE